MSYNFEESNFSTGILNSGASFDAGSITYSTSGGMDSNAIIASSGSLRAADSTSRIASDLLLGAGAGAGSASYSASYSNYGAGSGSGALALGSGALALGSGSGAGASISYGSSSGAAYGSAAGAAGSVFLSEIEQAILRSADPITINESEEITVNGLRGIWANRAEVVNWRGAIPITQYLINEDSNPELITKRSVQLLEYIQELAIRYLRPPTPPAPGEIIIQQQANMLTAPAPPLIIRQQPARPATPEPLVVREAPPQPPAQVGRKVITISGKRIPPPPRKVVVERLAPLPAKPQSVIIERWLPYAQVKRRVIFQKPAEADPVVVKPRNVIVQWEAPRVNIRKEIKYLGVIRANPAEYVTRYGATLKQATELPEFVTDIRTPDGLVLAANYRYNSLHELEGDLQALRLVDLEREGLAEYRSYLQRLGISFDASAGASFAASGASFGASGASLAIGNAGAAYSIGGGASFAAESSASRGSLSAFAEQVFSQLDVNGDGSISISEAEKALLRLNSRLGRNYGEDDVRSFFARLDSNRDGKLDINEFRVAFFNLLN